jgi:hypothetical protein
MIKLEIKKPDGSIYWTEHFNNQADGDKWLAEEKTRKYWDVNYAHVFTDLTPPVDPSKEAAEKAKVEKKLKDFGDLAKLKPGDVTSANINSIVEKIIGLLT